MNYFFKLFFLIITTSFYGQFNTLSYPVKNKKLEHLQQSFSVSEAQKETEKKDAPKPKKKKWFTTKADLKKELDSLKILVIELREKKTTQNINFKKIEDSIIHIFQEKFSAKSTNNSIPTKSIKKYDFIREEVIKKISMPLDRMIITSPFGFRTHPIFGGRKMHNGIDLGANYENVYSVLDGVVSEAGWDINGGGNYIKIRHSNRFETAYLHLSHIYYKKGEPVKAGYIIGKSGNSGNSTGPHLHFSVKEFGVFINPTQFLNDLIKVNNLISIHYEQQFANR